MFQNVQRVATLGCLVKDATAVYALTSLRAVGDEGREVAIVIEGGARRIGRSDARHVGALPFSAVYPGLSGTQTDLELDAGLVRLDDLRGVTSQIFGVGEPGSMSELSPATAGLDLMGLAVKSSSCIAGVTSGKIAGLFYRFRSGEGNDTICELLIGPNEDSPGSGHAERLASVATSGALWLAEDSDGTRPPQPIACWLAGQRLDSTVATFALAASLSTVAKLLDVSIVRDWNAGLPTQWASLKPLDGPDETGKHVSRAPSKANSKRDVRTTGTSKKRRR